MHIKTATAVTLKLNSELEAGAANSIITAHTSSETLFAGKRELLIAHGAEHYRLRLTSQGKLILTK
jgi:hemin uptake protein HemP